MKTTTCEPITRPPSTEPRVTEGPTLREAVTRYLDDHGFDKTYSEWFVRVDIGPFPFFVANIPARRRVVKYHDLHHTVTGYETDLRGEGEISAWELGADCGPASHWFAYGINAQGMLMGLALAPRRTWRAFLRGRRCTSLYRVAYDDALLDTPLAEVKARVGVDRTQGEATAADRLAFLGWVCAGAATFASVLLPPLAGVALATAWFNGWLG